jgi:hypothetical protein
MTITLDTLKTRLSRLIGDDHLTLAHRYIHAINNASRDLYTLAPLFKRLLDDTLITGNILPNSHFEDWAATTAPDWYAVQDANITALQNTTAGNQWGGTKSMRVLTGASGAGKYIYITSDTYPPLLDLMGKTVSAYVWAKPEDADEAYIEIYSLQADGTAQTLTSTTTNPAGEFTLLKLEDQALNDDLVEVQVRFKLANNSKYVFFDNARVMGGNVHDYMLPDDFQNGVVSQVWLQSSSHSDYACDDLHPRYTEEFGWNTFTDTNGYKYLRFPYTPTSGRKVRLIGYCPLEDDLDDDDDTISLDNPMHINILLNYAAHLIYEMESGVVSGQSVERYQYESTKWLNKAMYLINQGGAMTEPQGQIHWTI